MRVMVLTLHHPVFLDSAVQNLHSTTCSAYFDWVHIFSFDGRTNLTWHAKEPECFFSNVAAGTMADTVDGIPHLIPARSSVIIATA